MITPIKLTFNDKGDKELALKKYLKDRILSLKSGLKELHETRLVKWRKSYEAVPAEKVREFPFYNASNLVIPIIAIHSDTLLARVMSAVIKNNPLWVSRLIGNNPDLPADLSNAIETFMQYVGLEPSELDLYRVYHEWFGEAIKFGTSVVKCPIDKRIEDVATPGDGTGRYKFEKRTIYDGPRPEKLAFEDFLIPPAAKTIELADFKAHRVRLQRHQLEERKFRQVYDSAAVETILKQPDRTSPEIVQAQKESDAGAYTVAGYGFAEWDIYECHYQYRLDGNKFVKLITWYHEKSDTILRNYFRYYPDEIFVAARLFYRDDMFHGYGFCETLEMFQEEISQAHNQDNDNRTISNTRVWRVDPDSKLHQGYRVYPGAMIPADKDEIEPLMHGEVSQMGMDKERMSIELSERRSGVSPPQQGMGSGVMSKRGIYTAQGTMALIQEGNTRTDLNITDIRYAHTRLGRLLCNLYAHFGIGDRAKLFGDLGPKVEMALAAFKDKKIALPIYASTSSINREVEKQNDILLSSIMARHYQTITGMMQAAGNPMLPEDVRKYIGESITASNLLMKSVLRHFEYDEVDKYVPTARGGAPTSGGLAPGGAPSPTSGATFGSVPGSSGPRAHTPPGLGGFSELTGGEIKQ